MRFEGLGLFAITGRTGAGKSSLLEALVFALYHATTFDKRAVTSLISDGAEDLTVSLEFIVLAQRWQVTRSISRAHRQAVHELRGLDTGERLDRKVDVDERIETLLGLSCDDFLKTVVLPQGQFQALLQSSPADRAPLLKNLLGLDQLDRLAEYVAKQREQLSLAVQQGQGRRQALPERPAELVEAARARLEELRRREEALAVQVQRVELLDREGQRLERELAGGRRQLESLRALELPAAQELARLDELDRTLQAESATTGQWLEENQRQLAELEARQLSGLPRWRERWRELASGSEQLERDRQEQTRLQQTQATEAQELSELTQATAGRRLELEALTARGTALAARVEEARQALATHRQALGFRRTTEETRENRWRVMQDLREHLTVLEEQLHRRDREAQQAGEALRQAERAHLVAALCADHAGPDCPVCERPLPERFEIPVAADLESVRQSAEVVQQAARELAARTQQARGGFAAVSEELLRLDETLAQVPEVADLGAQEEALSLLEREHRLLQEGWLAQHRECERWSATAAEKERHLERSRQELARLEQRCALRAAELEAEGQALAKELELPDLTGAEQRLADLELRSRELEEQREACRQALFEGHRRQAELASRRQSELERPRRAAQSQLTALGALLDALGDARETVDAEHLLNAHQRLSERRDALGARLEADLAGLLQAASEQAAQMAELLGAQNPDEVRAGWVAAREERALQARALELCERDREQAERLDEVLEPARRRWRQLEFLHEALGNRRGKGRLSFSQWLLEQRQQELLVLASRTFAQMSSGQYGFSAQFQVVDRSSGQARKPNTLSGGESFLASLSLALALSELVGRRGGRLEAFFLDEGFGSLSSEALDRALDALELLASSGRMIGIISHVGLVAERIEKVWCVTRTPEGSRLEDLQPHQRARLARQEVYDSAEHPLLATLGP